MRNPRKWSEQPVYLDNLVNGNNYTLLVDLDEPDLSLRNKPVSVTTWWSGLYRADGRYVNFATDIRAESDAIGAAIRIGSAQVLEPTSQDNATLIGRQAQAHHANSISIGTASISGTPLAVHAGLYDVAPSVAIGSAANARNGGVALGIAAKASDTNDGGTLVFSESGVAIGAHAEATGHRSVAIGAYATVAEGYSYGCAIGYGAAPVMPGEVAIGSWDNHSHVRIPMPGAAVDSASGALRVAGGVSTQDAVISDKPSRFNGTTVAGGPDGAIQIYRLTPPTLTPGLHTIYMGDGITGGSGNWNVVIGDDAVSTGPNIYSVIVGVEASAAIGNGVAVGHRAAASNDGAVAVGKQATAEGDGTVCVGVNTSSAQSNAISIGKNANSAGYEALAIGKNAFTTGGAGTGGASVIALGVGARAGHETNCADSIAIGTSATTNIANGRESIVIGLSATALERRGVAIGPTAQVGRDAVALGSAAQATFQYSVAIGAGAVTASLGQIVLGTALNHNHVNIPMTNAATSTTTGALRVAGGVGIQGALHVGGGIKVAGDITFGSAYVAGAPTPTGYLVVRDVNGVAYKIPAQALI